MKDSRQKGHECIRQTLGDRTHSVSQPSAEYVSRLEAQLIEMKEIEQDLKRLAIVVRDSNDAITMQDLDGNILAWNKGAEKIYGYTEKEALNLSIFQLIPEHKQEEMVIFTEKLKNGDIVKSFETQRLTKDRKVLDIWLTVTPITDDQGRITTIASTERDITEKNRLIRELAALSLKDDLTGVYNRRGFNIFSEKLLQLIKRRNRAALLIYLDMDNLKRINDNFGHKKGDEAIKRLARVLHETFRKTDVIARMGGDEFAIMTEVDKDSDGCEEIIKRLNSNIKGSNEKENRFHIEVSIGTVLQNYDEVDLDQMLNQADQEMYREKRQKHSEQKMP